MRRRAGQQGDGRDRDGTGAQKKGLNFEGLDLHGLFGTAMVQKGSMGIMGKAHF